MKTSARIAASVLFLLALGTICLQIPLTYETYGTAWATFARLSWFFTLLTNFLVCVSFGRIAISGRMLSASWLGGLTVWISLVAIVYHTMLAHLYDPVGAAWVTDLNFHTLIPAGTVLFWLVFAPKAPLPWISAVYWLAWPLIYVVYAIVRGAFTGAYPYPFFDLNKISLGEFVMNTAGLCFGFFVAGLILIGVARLTTR